MQAGLSLNLTIGQHVRLLDFKARRVTGKVRGLSISDNVLFVDVALDEAIVIPASADCREVSIWNQHVPAHEATPFDTRDEVLTELLSAASALLEHAPRCFALTESEESKKAQLMDAVRRAIANARSVVA